MSDRWTIMKCGDDWDWYVLVDANLQHLSDASVEGDAHEWRLVADALLKGESVSFKRLRAKRVGDSYEFCSPRNTMGRSAKLEGRQQAERLAADILAIIEASS